MNVHQAAFEWPNRFFLMTDKDLYSPFSEEVLKRAEEMSSKISSTVSLDRRGDVEEFAGVISDLAEKSSKPVRVRVAITEENDWLMLISEKALKRSERALLVYRPETGPDIRRIGNHGNSRPGLRQADWDSKESRYFAQYRITRNLPPSEPHE